MKTFNRVCVAFSRAKIGFYVIGNIDCIVEGELAQNKKYNDKENANRMAKVWSQIQQRAKEKNIIGPVLKVCCQTHNKETEIKSKTFKSIQEANDYYFKNESNFAQFLDRKKKTGSYPSENDRSRYSFTRMV